MIQVGIFRIDLFSFGLGFFTGAMFLFLITQLFRMIPAWFRAMRDAYTAMRRSMTANVESKLANEIIAFTQRQHLAANLFSLNEIAIQPTLMAPPPPADLIMEYLIEEITHQVLPYMPDWPEAAGAYSSPNLTMAEALQEGASILLMGHPGSGKTFAMAHFANQLLNGQITHNHLEQKVPILVHVADMLPKLEEKEPLSVIVSAMSTYVSPIVQPSLNDLLENFLKNEQMILLVDGLDELEHSVQNNFRTYLSRLLDVYPKLQMVVAASPDFYAGINHLGLVPLAISAWSDRQRLTFIEQWDARWKEHIQKLLPGESLAIDGLILKGWLFSGDAAITPLELTLRAWGAYAGDMLSPELPKLIEAHLRRMTAAAPNLRFAMEGVALHMVASEKLLINQRDADHVARKGGSTVSLQGEPTEDSSTPLETTNFRGGNLQSLLETGLVTIHPGSMVRFIHPVFTGYLAGKALVSQQTYLEAIFNQPNWTGKLQTIQYLSSFADVSESITEFLEGAQPNPLYKELFIAARWLRTAQRNQAWRSSVMRTLANIIYREFETSALASRAMIALAISGDPGAPTLFRQLLKSQNNILRRLSVLGIGLVGDPKTIVEISPLAEDEDKNVGRAVCMALVRIGTKQAVDALISILLHGSEAMRIAASESLAIHPTEGMEILNEALTMEDLLVRRAAIFGLMRINPPDLPTTLESVAVKDSQWVVRNAAAQALEMVKTTNPFAPHPIPTSEDIPWLLAYAGKNGVGLANEQQAFDMVLNAMERGNETEQILAMQFLNLRGKESAAPQLYSTYYSSRDELRDMAFNTIWHMYASGEEMPSPIQFGLG